MFIIDKITGSRKRQFNGYLNNAFEIKRTSYLLIV